LGGELRGKWGRKRWEEGDEGDGKREGEGEIKYFFIGRGRNKRVFYFVEELQ
jgi:hypothetical protein